MRKFIKRYYDSEHRALVVDKSIVRYEDVLWVFHGAWADPETGKVKVLLSSRTGSKMRLVHDRDRKNIVLEYTMR